MSHSLFFRRLVPSEMALAIVLILSMPPALLAESPANTAIAPEGHAIWVSALKPFLQDAGPSSSAEMALPEPEKLSLWFGQAPLGDGQFEAADAAITVHRPVAETAMGRLL